jgi:hypothetical protein
MVCASPGQIQAGPPSQTNPYSCQEKINLTYGGGAPLGTTCVGDLGMTNVQCGFPFTYGGKANYQCTTQDSATGGPWCYRPEDAKTSNLQTCGNSSTKACVVTPLAPPPSQRARVIDVEST